MKAIFFQIFTILAAVFPIFPSITQAYHFSADGNTIYDLESTDSASFTSEAGGWYSSTLNGGTKVSACWGLPIMGGYNILSSTSGYFYRTYSLPNTHNTVYLSFRGYQVDSWDPGDDDHFNVYVAGTTITGWTV